MFAGFVRGRQAADPRETNTRGPEVVLYLLGLDQHHVVAGLRAGVAAAGQRQKAGLLAGGAGAGVAAVSLSGRVVAGRRTPEEQMKH